jgi:hypothetical protein
MKINVHLKFWLFTRRCRTRRCVGELTASQRREESCARNSEGRYALQSLQTSGPHYPLTEQRNRHLNNENHVEYCKGFPNCDTLPSQDCGKLISWQHVTLHAKQELCTMINNCYLITDFILTQVSELEIRYTAACVSVFVAHRLWYLRTACRKSPRCC